MALRPSLLRGRHRDSGLDSLLATLDSSSATTCSSLQRNAKMRRATSYPRRELHESWEQFHEGLAAVGGCKAQQKFNRQC